MTERFMSRQSSLEDIRVVHEIVTTWADRSPDRAAIRFAGQDCTWRQLRGRVARTVSALASLGVGGGDHVAVVAKNSPVGIELLMAASQLGAAVTMVNWRLTRREVEFVLSHSDAKVAFVEDEFRDRVSGAHLLSADYEAFGSFVDSFDEADRAESKVEPESTALVLYSSGTTGSPKGVMLSHRALLWRARSALRAAGGAQLPDHWCAVPMPMFHIGGFGATLHSLALGRRVTILREARVDLMATAIQEGATQAFLAPTVIRSVLEDPELRSTFGRLRELKYGSSPMTLSLVRATLDAWPNISISQGYGATETAGSITDLGDEDHRRATEALLRSVGRAASDTELAIFDPDTLQPLPAGRVGEIWVRAPYLSSGYYKDPQATKAAFTDDGWFRTGDLGEVDREGYIFIRDRLKDMIISGGENIYSAEVEWVISEFPGVQSVAVVGEPDEKWGERPVAYIEVRPGMSIDTGKLANHCRENLAGFKCPTRFEMLHELPRNATGKTVKALLRPPAVASGDRDLGHDD